MIVTASEPDVVAAVVVPVDPASAPVAVAMVEVFRLDVAPP